MEEIKISNRQIALMAFDRLRKEDKTDSALKLARCMLHGTSISLGIGDIDWEIDRAIQQCGGVPRTGYRYTAYFHFNRNTEMAKEIQCQCFLFIHLSYLCTAGFCFPYIPL